MNIDRAIDEIDTIALDFDSDDDDNGVDAGDDDDYNQMSRYQGWRSTPDSSSASTGCNRKLVSC